MALKTKKSESVEQLFEEKEVAGSSRESFAALYEETLKNLNEGDIVDGTIVGKREREVLVDIGYKSEGTLSLEEFSNPEELNVGDTMRVLLESVEDENGMVVISKKKADRVICWDSIVNNNEEGSVIEGKIFKKVKGGFMVDIGMEAFLPASLVDLKPTRNLDQFLGLQGPFVIVKINLKRKNIVVSRKDYLESKLQENRSKLLEEIEEGKIIKGRVKNITDFGAFVDLGGVDGLLHITDMSWGRVSHPSEMLAIGDEVELMVIAFDRQTNRVSLGLKQKTANPWEDAENKYPVNSKVKGRVVNILPYGAFVELEKGIEGLVHISELSWTKRVTHPSDMLAIGDIVEAIVLSVDTSSKKIALGLKQTEVNPWLLVEEKYEIGSTIEGKVRNVTDYGVFLELEPGIDGLVHISDISWIKKINHPGETYKKGQKIHAKVLAVDQAAKKISLGIKQLEPDPWETLVQELEPGTVIEGLITKIPAFGIFIEVRDGLEGLVHISEIPENRAKNLSTHYSVGQTINVMVLKVDNEGRKIALSLKGDDGADSDSTEAPAEAHSSLEVVPEDAAAAEKGSPAAEPQDDAPTPEQSVATEAETSEDAPADSPAPEETADDGASSEESVPASDEADESGDSGQPSDKPSDEKPEKE